MLMAVVCYKIGPWHHVRFILYMAVKEYVYSTVTQFNDSFQPQYVACTCLCEKQIRPYHVACHICIVGKPSKIMVF